METLPRSVHPQVVLLVFPKLEMMLPASDTFLEPLTVQMVVPLIVKKVVDQLLVEMVVDLIPNDVENAARLMEMPTNSVNHLAAQFAKRSMEMDPSPVSSWLMADALTPGLIALTMVEDKKVKKKAKPKDYPVELKLESQLVSSLAASLLLQLLV